MFKYKTEEELGKMTADQRDIYGEQKRDFEAKVTQKMIADAIKDAMPDSALAKFNAAKVVNQGKTDDEIKAIVIAADVAEKAAETERQAEFKELKETVNQIKEQGSAAAAKESDIQANIAKEWKEQKEKIKGLAKATSREEVQIKANVTRASVATPNVGGNIPGIGQLGYIKRSFYDVCTKIQIASNNNDTGVIPYTDWDEATVVRAAAVVAEGAAFPESTAAFKGYTLPIRKIGDTLPVSEEFFEDEALAAGELKMFLEVNVNTAVDGELINGDNTGEHLKGLIASTPAYTLPVTGTVTDGNIYDLIRMVMTDITKTRGSKYNPQFVIMNSSTIDRLILKKDRNNNYQFPPNHPIYSMIVEDNNVLDNEMVVGDTRYARIYEKVGVILSQGVVNAQFTSDMMTLKARTRLAFLIRTVDQTGFRKVTDVTAALVAITATAP